MSTSFFKNRRNIFLLTGAALTALLLIILWPSPEPSYQNKSLSQWLDLYQKSSQNADATNAVHAIGTNAIPLLITWLKYERPAWRKVTISLMDALPTALGDRKLTYWLRFDVSTHHQRALNGFEILGPAATSAIPAVVQQLTISASNSPSGVPVRTIFAANALAFIGKDSLPPLLPCLTNTNTAVFQAATTTLNLLAIRGVDITPAVPALLERLHGQNEASAKLAAWAFGILKLQPETVVPQLISALKDPRPLVRRSCAQALGEFSDDASSATPFLVPLLTDPDRSVRQAATNALLKISPASLPATH